MKLSKHAKFWALGALGGVGLFALGVFAQQTLQINPSEQDLFSDLKAVFFLDRNGDEIKSIVRWNASGSTLVTAPTSELTGGEAKNTLQNNASIIGSTDSSNTSAGAFLIATNGGKVEWESMQSFIWGANNTTLSGFNTIAVATKDTNINADNALALASKKTYITAKDAIAIGWEDIKLKGQASLAIWSKIDSAAQGAMVFNANNERLNLNNESNNTFVINVKNGLIVNTNTSANPNIQLTVSGAIKLWEVNNAPAQASPYISTKKVGNVICVCGKVNNGNIAISKYSRNNKQHAEICQKVCNNESPTLPGQCGAAATNYPLGQTQWSTDDFCQWGLGYAGAKPTFPALGGQTTWTCESFPSGGVNCTASRKGCGDGIRAAGEQCDLGTNNGKPDSNCSTSCENVKAPKCWANAKTYLGSDVAWAQPNGFCTDDSVLGEATPAFWNGSTSGQKTWTCKNKNGKNLNCSANRLPPAVAGVCGTTLNTCSAGTLSGQTSIAHGNRWSCDGLYGGSNKTCSRCESGYKYNTTTNICEIDCPNPIYRHTNGVTIKAADCAEAGKEYLFEGQKYYVARDKNDIKAKIGVNIYPANRIVTTRVTDMGQMFKRNSSFNQDIGNWDTSKVTNMHEMFNWARAFNQPLNNWDTSKVTYMQGMFNSAYAFKQPLNNWDTSKVTNMHGMFYQAHAFNQPLNNWDTSKVTDMSYMFNRAEAFDQPLNNWDTSKVTNMWAMFAWAKAFNQSLNNWDTSKVTYMRAMFAWALAFDQPLNNWDISKVTDMESMFDLAKAFNQPLNNWDISKVINMSYMFNWAQAFRNNQPYCNWANWSAKKWNFVNMGLNACATSPSKVNGQCKAYPWNHASQPATATANACVAGDYQDIPDDANNWKWKCIGKYGATSTECSASKQPAPVNAQCKVYPWNHTSQPASSTTNGCLAGDYQDIADDSNSWKWKCNGGNGGSEEICSATKYRTCSTGFTLYNGYCVKWECKTTPTPPPRPTLPPGFTTTPKKPGSQVSSGSSTPLKPLESAHYCKIQGIGITGDQACLGSSAIKPSCGNWSCEELEYNWSCIASKSPQYDSLCSYYSEEGLCRRISIQKYKIGSDPFDSGEMWVGITTLWWSPKCTIKNDNADRATWPWRRPTMWDGCSIDGNTYYKFVERCKRKQQKTITCLDNNWLPVPDYFCWWTRPSIQEFCKDIKIPPRVLKYNNKNVNSNKRWILGKDLPFSRYNDLEISIYNKDTYPQEDNSWNPSQYVHRTNTVELHRENWWLPFATISFLNDWPEMRTLLVKVEARLSSGKEPYFYELVYDPVVSDLTDYYTDPSSSPSQTPLYMLHYNPYKLLDDEKLRQCRQSWTCLTSCSIVWSFAREYDDEYWWNTRKSLSSEFFCSHGPYWGTSDYTIRPIYIKWDWRPNRYYGTSLSSYSFWLDSNFTIPAPNWVYNTNLTAAHASSANESFYEEKVHWMKLYNGRIIGGEVIQEK